ncbi:MAG: hypothetical protein U5L45_17845 [Saprospiraceae bacterium]|nr:hypothetical protein [Saprospiraceae bacterium]
MKKNKLTWLFHRLVFSLVQIPSRIKRVVTVWYAPFYRNYPIFVRLQSLGLLLLDLFFIFDVLEIFNNLVRPHIRTLTDIEIVRGRKMFGKSLDFRLVLLDKRSIPVKRGFAYAFVTFNTVNCWKPIPADVFIHELTHVWQYQNFGAGYMAAALYAQRTPAGYNYTYTEGWHLSKHLLDFNAEQQADLIQDAYRMQMQQYAQWQPADEQSDEMSRLVNSVLT